MKEMIVVAIFVWGGAYVAPAQTSLQFNVKRVQDNGQFLLQLAGKAGHNYRIDASPDLFDWSFLSSSNPPSGTFEYLETKTGTLPQRFYRATESPEVVGQVRNLGRGTVRSWMRVDGAGKPAAIGVTLTEAALTNLPSSGSELVLLLPQQAEVTAFNHIGLNWNPQGHPPPGIYGVPHFDVHFYTISQQERKSINLNDGGTKMYRDPDPQYLPQDYVLSPGSGDPGQGSHWEDQAAPELNGEPFTYTFIYGYYDGQLTFLEPMVTRAFLKTNSTVIADIKQPAAFAKPGLYPTQYQVTHSSLFREFSISLEGLTSR
jgi:hypothetical protein